MDAELCLKWRLDLLQWDEAEFDGLSSLKIWPNSGICPEIYQHDFRGSARPRRVEFKNTLNLTSDGTIRACESTSIAFSCDSDMGSFPRDEHECSASFIPGMKSNLRLSADLKCNFTEFDSVFPEWRILSMSFNSLGKIKAHPVPLLLTVNIQRDFSLHFLNFIVPIAISVALTVAYCWVNLRLLSKVHLMILSLFINVLTSISYSESLSDSTKVPIALRLSADALVLSAVNVLISIVSSILDDSRAAVLLPMPRMLRKLLESSTTDESILSLRVMRLEEDIETHDGPPRVGIQSDVKEESPEDHIRHLWESALVLLQRCLSITFLGFYVSSNF
ncbi:acetylcholine receptor subunit beta-type acr-3-like [Galendromus occidentalis]|uniref:Acetylcholine receptor subunit beta-type acr-3-like n=1 Tax=Galendromus occidentalis TaxID=34638 RepID=A0AAJ7L839_9ACAR|nr:acetylcholine receptor subunit beta-type acr-3-like [Galendromus occidentalis]